MSKPLRIPPYLTGEAEKFWRKHAARLQSEGTITDADVEGFALLCQVWAVIQATDPLVDGQGYMRALRQWQSLAKQYGMLPKDRRRAGLNTEYRGERDEYGIPS